MLSLAGVGKEWASLGFLHPDNHLHNVNALSFQGGERIGRSNSSPPPKKQSCMHIHDRVRLMLSLIRVGKDWASPVFLHPDNHLHKVDAYLVRVWKEWAAPVFPHPLKSQGCMHIHDSVRLMLSLAEVGKEWPAQFFSTQITICTRLVLYLVKMGKEWASPVFPHPLKAKVVCVFMTGY